MEPVTRKGADTEPRSEGAPARRVVVTGGAGTLGREVVAVLGEHVDTRARVLSRRERPADAPAECEWFQADLLVDRLETALRGADVVLHLASAKGQGDADLLAAERLLAAARQERVRHLVFVSIIGCDRIPLPFYGSKVRIERAVQAGGVPWTVVRVAQFHSFVERLVRSAATPPVPMPVFSELRFQPVDEREVAQHLVRIGLGPPLGFAPEIAGPEVLTLGEIAATWLELSGTSARLVPVALESIQPAPAAPQPEPWVRPVLEGYRSAYNAARGERTLGSVRFADWLRARQGAR